MQRITIRCRMQGLSLPLLSLFPPRWYQSAIANGPLTMGECLDESDHSKAYAKVAHGGEL